MGTEFVTYRSTGVWVETPLIYSSYISDRLGCSVHLKLENLQLSQSFKYRGISLRLQKARAQYGSALHVFIASAGNAGLAAAVAARSLDIRCTVYLPVVVTKDTQDILRNQGANVVLAGQIYSDALTALYQAVEGDPNAIVLSSYDDPILWKGHSSMVDEMKSQAHLPPDAIFCAVGGCGLIGGILLGCQSVSWGNVPVVALETHGSNCFYNAISLNTQGFSSKVPSLPKKIPLEAPYSVRISEEHSYAYVDLPRRFFGSDLACTRCSAHGFGPRRGNDMSRLFDGHVPAYNHELFWRILDPKSELSAEERRRKSVIFVVRGGVKVTADELSGYAQVLDQAESVSEWKVICNGTDFCVGK